MKLNATQLKIIALVFMTLEHVCYVFSSYINPNVVIIAKVLGRIAAPLFIFFAVESFMYTTNKARYLLRLVIAAVIMQSGNYLMSKVTGLVILPNIFAAIACSIAMLWCMNEGLPGKVSLAKKVLMFSCATALFVFSLFLEGSFLIPALVFIFYFLRNKAGLYIVFSLLSLYFLLPAKWFGPLGDIVFPYQWGMMLTLPFISFYNGARGPGLKYLFYIYYPLHLWLLYFLLSLVR